MIGNARGTATIEGLLVGLVLLVPLIWLLAVLADVHAAALATTSAAREAAVAAVRQTNTSEAREAADRAVLAAVVDAGLGAVESHLAVAMPAGLARGALVTTQVSYRVPLVAFPLLGSGPGPSITVSARSSAAVDPFASR